MLCLTLPALGFLGCTGTTEWPSFEPERTTFKYPSGVLNEGVAAQLWGDLVSQVQQVVALGAPPLLMDAVDLPLGPVGTDLIDYRTTELSADCPRGGSARFSRHDAGGLADRFRVEFAGCRYDVTSGALLFPQELDGTAWVEAEEGGLVFLQYDGQLYVDGHRTAAVINMAWGLEDLNLNAAGGGGDVIASIDLPGPGLSGTVTFEATNGTFECQVDASNVYCVELHGSDSFQASITSSAAGGDHE